MPPVWFLERGEDRLTVAINLNLGDPITHELTGCAWKELETLFPDYRSFLEEETEKFQALIEEYEADQD